MDALPFAGRTGGLGLVGRSGFYGVRVFMASTGYGSGGLGGVGAHIGCLALQELHSTH